MQNIAEEYICAAGAQKQTSEMQQVHKNRQVKFVLSEEKLRIHSHLIIAT